MSRRCELTAKGPQVGHTVSHSNIKTKRRFLPNLLNVTLMSDSLGKSFKLRISANALKSVDHRGGLDAFLAKARDMDLSPKALEIKRAVKKKLAGGRGSRSRLPGCARQLIARLFSARYTRRHPGQARGPRFARNATVDSSSIVASRWPGDRQSTPPPS